MQKIKRSEYLASYPRMKLERGGASKFNSGYAFTKPKGTSLYVNILKGVMLLDFCKCHPTLNQIKAMVFGTKGMKRGYCSSLFAAMLHDDLLRMKRNGRTFEYWLGDRGIEILNMFGDKLKVVYRT